MEVPQFAKLGHNLGLKRSVPPWRNANYVHLSMPSTRIYIYICDLDMHLYLYIERVYVNVMQ